MDLITLWHIINSGLLVAFFTFYLTQRTKHVDELINNTKQIEVLQSRFQDFHDRILKELDRIIEELRK